MAKHKKPINKPVERGERPNDQRVWHAGPDGISIEPIDAKMLGGAKRARITTQTLLDRYRQREQITKRQYDAGLELYRIWHKSGRGVKTVNYEAVRVDGSGSGGETSGEAFSAYMSALRAIGVDLSSVAQWVAIQGMSAADWAERQSHGPKGGIVALRLALDALGDHFGMAR